jgi:hypothetical protein
MTRESRSKADVRILWMGIDDEVLARRHRARGMAMIRHKPDHIASGDLIRTSSKPAFLRGARLQRRSLDRRS